MLAHMEEWVIDWEIRVFYMDTLASRAGETQPPRLCKGFPPSL